MNINVQHSTNFFRTMYERQLIWKRRFINKAPAPWTLDKILGNYKFTNIYRELDRNSQYEINKIILPNKNAGINSVVWKTFVFRLFNKPETFERLSDTWLDGIPMYDTYLRGQKNYANAVLALAGTGFNVFTSAYFINSKNAGPGNCVNYYVNTVLPELHSRIPEIIYGFANSYEPGVMIAKLKLVPGVGNFIAYELYRSLLCINKFVPFIPKDACAKYELYVNIGNGSKAGIKLIYPDIHDKCEIINAMASLLLCAERELSKLSAFYHEDMPYAHYDFNARTYKVSDQFNLTLDNIEHWLCEYYKYEKTASTQSAGKSRQKFKPISNNNLYG